MTVGTEVGTKSDGTVKCKAQHFNIVSQHTSLKTHSNNTLITTLCIISFLLSFKPSEPYLTNYLIDDKQLTEQQINQNVYPIYTYAYMCTMLPIAYLAYRTNYKYMLILCCISREITRLLLIYASTLLSMQLMQITFGIAQVDVILFPTYIYCIFNDTAVYTRAIALYYSSNLAGHAVAGITAQMLLSYTSCTYVDLQYIATISVSIGFVLLLLLLPNDKTLRHNTVPYTSIEQVNVTRIAVQPVNTIQNERNNNNTIWTHIKSFVSLYCSSDVLLWSFCFCCTYGVIDIVWGYCLSLYYEISIDNSITTNGQGISDVVSRMSSSIAAVIPGYVKLKLSDNTLMNAIIWCITTSLLAAITLNATTHISSIILAYILVACCVSISAFFVTLTTTHISYNLTVLQFSVVYTVNIFIATCIQSVLLFIASDSVLALTARQTFQMCSIQLAIVSCICIVVAAVQYIKPLQYKTAPHNNTPDTYEPEI